MDVVEHFTEDLPVTPTRARRSALDSGIRHLIDRFDETGKATPNTAARGRTFEFEEDLAGSWENKESGTNEKTVMPSLTHGDVAMESGILPPDDLDDNIAEPPPPSTTPRDVKRILSHEIVQPLQESTNDANFETPDVFATSDTEEEDSFKLIEGRDRHDEHNDVKLSEKTLRDEESRVNKWTNQYPNESKAYIPINIYATTKTDLDADNELSASEEARSDVGREEIRQEPVFAGVTVAPNATPDVFEPDNAGEDVEEESDENIAEHELIAIEPSDVGGEAVESEDHESGIEAAKVAHDEPKEKDAEPLEMQEVPIESMSPFLPPQQRLEDIAREDIEKPKQDEDFHYCGCDAPGLCIIS